MDNRELNRTLKTQARKLGLCDEWYDGWEKNESKQELIEKYLKGIDFCIKHDYPTLQFARENFPKNLLIQNGIFLDERVDASNLSKAVLLGESKGILFYNGQKSCDVYVRHESQVEIFASEGSKVFVETYENCNVSVIADKFSKVFVYRHGGHIQVEGNVIIREREKR